MTCPTRGRPQLTEHPHVHVSPKTHRDPPTSPPPQADAAAREVWAELERLPGFNERVAKGRAQLDAGQRVPFDPDPLTVEPIEYRDEWANGRGSRYRLIGRKPRRGCSVLPYLGVGLLVIAWRVL